MRTAFRTLSLCLIACAAGLSGCATSAPVRYYTLNATAVAPAAPPLAGRSILVGPVELPPYLDRPQMAIRGTAGQIEFLEYQRWSEPLEASFTRILVDDLILLAGTGQAMAAPVPGDLRIDYRLRARISRFDVDAGGQAVLVVQWYIVDNQGKVLTEPRQSTYRRESQRLAPAEARAAASAAALSATVADFAADVIRSISSAGAVTS